MRLRRPIPAVLVCAGLSLFALAAARDDTLPPIPEGEEVLARGPVHEAFAEATTSVAAPAEVVDRQPPTPIDEMPSAEKPEGDHVVWIPGYWAYDDEAKDFIWVSGFWRAVPPGRTWVPGSWQKVEGGWQWVPGYWGVEGQTEETEYLPPPPQSLDTGPTTPAPDDTSTYIPGNWVFQSDRYLWRPGYWVKYYPDWVWTPASYRWTPAGYVSVSGYWDRPLTERGLLFAPVRFTRPVYRRRDFVYQPSLVVQPDFLLGSLFIRPKTHHFYFGDYFDSRYKQRYVPWMDYHVVKNVPDVNFGHYRAAYARHPAWERNLRTLYTTRYAGEVPRPPRTLAQQRTVIRDLTGRKSAGSVVHRNVNITHAQNVTALAPIRKAKNVQVTGLSRLANIPPREVKTAPVHRPIRVETVQKERIAEERKHAERLRVYAQQRQATETKLSSKAPAHKLTAPVRAKVTMPRQVPPARVIRPPVAPPTRPVVPKVDPNRFHQPGKPMKK